MSICCKKDEHIDDSCYKNKYIKEFCNYDKLCLKKCKPLIKEVIESFIKVVIKSCRIIRTCLGPKILIKGYKMIKIHYVADDKCGKVVSECFCVPFCEFIPIECKHNVKVCEVDAGVEYSQIDNCTEKCIFVCTIIFIMVKVKESCSYNKPTHYYHCEIDSKCYCDDDKMNFKNDYLKELEQCSSSPCYDYNE